MTVLFFANPDLDDLENTEENSENNDFLRSQGSNFCSDVATSLESSLVTVVQANGIWFAVEYHIHRLVSL